MTLTSAPEACLVCDNAPGHALLFDGCLRQCSNCTFKWTATRGPTPTGQLYTSDYFASGGYHDYFRHTAQWRHEARRRLRWLLSATRPATLLEAGSAGGFFLEAARAAGIVVTGVEPSEACVRFAETSLGLMVRHGGFETAQLGTRVEAVCAFHVLEHVDDPRRFLDKARSALVPGGWLALEVPNVASAAAGRQGRSWHGLQPEYHHWHFDRRSLQMLLTTCGFAVHRCDTVLPRHYMRLRQRIRPSAMSRIAADWMECGSLHTVQPEIGDYLRVLARRSDGGQPS